ncbi:FHA domain containing protein [Desulforamulus reducens MI-1]|uniref:FHA domain containing protein n=1 Tax=Desulforamulus reducens (strain ATCC BAA-1160 / DSM 100696 / MI-1) TaxID=349161 RepID=A4J584_DESRM|nr:FHA domain-containing protein [Desulforamulus reducens]ABO50237.1 FHA domain containing protein [Desulforamulus reducens MI-1]
MLALVITLLRGLFLILLYLFIFRLTVSMIEQLRNSDLPNHSLYPAGNGNGSSPKPVVTGGDGAVLQVVTSREAHIKSGEIFQLGDITKLGRGRGNHIILDGHYASQEHACILYKQGQYWIEDLGSLNHTYLNNVPIKKQTVLANGDQIQIGDVIFHFVRWAYEMESNK